MSGNFQMPAPRPGRRRIMQAKFDGTCPICLQDILQGQDIEMTEDGSVHYGCKEE